MQNLKYSQHLEGSKGFLPKVSSSMNKTQDEHPIEENFIKGIEPTFVDDILGNMSSGISHEGATLVNQIQENDDKHGSVSDDMINLQNSTNIVDKIHDIADQNPSKASAFIEKDRIKDDYNVANEQKKLISDSNNLLELHSVEEKKELQDSQNKNKKSNLTDKQYDLNNKKGEKLNPIDNNENNDTEITSDTVADYIFLVDAKEFTGQMEIKNESSHVLNEYELEKYLDFITKLSRDHKMSFINKDYIEIQTIDSCKVTVRADYFNGLDVKYGRLNCMLCMVVVEDPARHVYDIEHIANVRRPLHDKHCFREINNSLIHCVHCNDTFNDFNFHKMLESHTLALKTALDRSFPSKPINPKLKNMIYCETCKIYTNSKRNEHANSRQHKKNAKLLIRKQKKKTHTESGPSGKTYCNQDKNQMKTQNVDAQSNQNVGTSYERDIDNPKLIDECDIICEPCNLKINKDKFPIHFYDKNHNENLKLTNTCEGIHKEMCTICNIYTDLSTHVTGAYHEYHVQKSEASTTLNQPSETDNSYLIKTEQMTKVICEICNKRFTIDPRNIHGHTHGRNHVSNYNGFIDVNLLKIVNNKFLCEICEVTVEPTEELAHIKTKTHKSALTQFNSGKTFCDKCKTYVLTANRSAHLTGDYHKYHIKQSNAPRNNSNVQTPFSLTSGTDTEYQITIKNWTEMVCKVCNCKLGKFPKIKGDLESHIKGRPHIRKYNELLFKNNIENVDGKLYCAVCKITVEISKELEHIGAKTHNNTLAQYKTDDSNVPINREHESAFSHQEHENSFFRLAKGLIEDNLLLTQVRDSVTCRLCNVNVPLELSKEHLKLPAHNDNYRNTLTKNRVQRVNNKYFCVICSVDVADREILRHVRSLTHLFERQLALPSSQTNSLRYCAVCDVPRN